MTHLVGSPKSEGPGQHFLLSALHEEGQIDSAIFFSVFLFFTLINI